MLPLFAAFEEHGADGRHAEAVEQFKAVDGYVKSLPWNYSFSPVQEYGWFRRDSVRRAR